MGVNLADTLPPLLRARGWTQEQLADATGIRRTDINALARGRLEAGPGRLQRIAEALGVSVLEFGVPEGESDAAGLTLVARLEEVEVALNRLGPQLARLGRRVAALEKRAPPKKRRGGSNG